MDSTSLVGFALEFSSTTTASVPCMDFGIRPRLLLRFDMLQGVTRANGTAG